MHACISGAIQRDPDGVVRTDPDKCIGRHLEQHKAYRCDRCPDRDVPACVSACPTGALVYRTVPDYAASVRRHASEELLKAQGG